MSLSRYPIQDTLPHRPPMVLIDEIVARKPGRITVAVTVRPPELFFRPGRGMPVHVALEWMAQACAAYGGADARDAGCTPRIGFLLGTRDFRATRSWLSEGERFEVEAVLDFHDDELASFSCEVTDARDGRSVARASLTVFHPRDAQGVVSGDAGVPS
jgi:predicted hotdog family 3-hydroxylacyl-ACP dehydratase